MVVHSIKCKAEFEEALKTHETVIIDAYATWCGPCRVISPVFEKLSEKRPKAYYVKIDVDEVPDVAEVLGIKAMPTFIFFQNGIKKNEITGANPVALENAITLAIGTSDS